MVAYIVCHYSSYMVFKLLHLLQKIKTLIMNNLEKNGVVGNITESRLQSECYTWFHNNYPEQRGLLFMVHNTPRNKIDGAKLKAMGMVAGVSDMVYLTSNLEGHGAIMLEFKLPGQYQSMEQKDWMERVRQSGYLYMVITSLDQFQRIIFNLQQNV